MTQQSHSWIQYLKNTHTQENKNAKNGNLSCSLLVSNSQIAAGRHTGRQVAASVK